MVVAVAVALAAVEAAAETRVALVIGNSGYQIGPLANPRNDAEAVDAALKGLGFRTRLLRDATKAQLETALSEFAGVATGADVAAVYFAGHGTERDGRNFIIPVDAKLARASDLDLQAVALDTVLAQLSGARKLKLVILDACRNNVFPVAGARRSTTRGLARVEPEDNTLVAYAAKDGTTADDGSGRHSPFTQSLLKHIATPGLEINFMLREVRDDVMAATNRQQTPHIYGTLGRERIFLGGEEPTAAPSAANPEVERLRAENERLRRQAASGAVPQGVPAVAPQTRPGNPPDAQPPVQTARNEPPSRTRVQLPPATAPLLDKDKARYGALVQSRNEALARSARNAGNDARALAALAKTRALLDAPAEPIDESQLPGAWTCTSHSIGGSLGDGSPQFAADVGSAFQCRIDKDRQGLVLRKTSGSMKKLARLVRLSDEEMLYYGTTIAQGDPQPVYPAGDPYGHEVGSLAQLGANRLRIELSQPNHSASAGHEVIELVRARR